MSNTTINVNINGKGTITGLDTVNKGLDGVAQKAKATNNSVNTALKFDFTASVPGLKTLETSVNGVGRAFNAIRSVATGGIIGAAVIRGISATVDESVKLENALIGVTSVARSFGQDTDDVKKAVLAFTKDGLVNATEAALAFKQILSTGTQLPDAIKLLNNLKDAAAFNRQSFYGLGEAIVATTEGIKNGVSTRADAVGVTKNLSVLEKEYAASLGRTVGSLSDQEKIQARVTGFIKEAAFASGDAAKLLDVYSGSISRLTVNFDRFLASLGSFVTQSSTVKSIIGGLTSGFDLFSRILTKDSPEQKLVKLKVRLRELEDQVKTESGVYITYAQNNAAAVRKQIDALSDSIFYQKLSSKAAQETAQAKISEKNITEAANVKILESAKKRSNELKKLDTKIQFGGDNDLQKLEKFYANGLKLTENDVARRLKLDSYYASEKQKISDKEFDKEQEKAKKLQQIRNDIASGFSAGSNNPFSTNIQIPQSVQAAGQKEVDKFKRNTDIGRGLSIAGNITQGADGAKALVSSVAAGALEKFAPGLGEAAKPLLDAFTQGPQAVKGMVKEFAKSIPDIVQGFIEAIPVFVEEIANQLPKIIERLAEKAPEIISKLVESAPRVAFALQAAMPKVAIKFASELVKNIPKIVSEIARAVYDAIRKVLSNLTGGLVGGKGDKAGGSGIKGLATTGFSNSGTLNTIANIATLGGSGVASVAFNKAKKIFGFSQGGEFSKLAVGGIPFQDSINSRLMGGELVVDRTTTSKLKKSLDGDGFGSNTQLQATLNKVVELLSRPMVVESDFNLNNATFAKAILNLSRTNQRTS